MRRDLLLLVLPTVVLGCGTEGDKTLDPRVAPAYSLSPQTQWSGGTVTLRSAGVAAANNPVVLSDGNPVAFERVDDTTLALTVPLGSSGTVAFVVQGEEYADSAGTMTRVGLRAADEFDGPFSGELREVVRSGVPWIVAENWGSGGQPGVVLANVVTGATTLVANLRVPVTSYGAGVTYRNDLEFILDDSVGVPGVYTLWPTPTRLGDVIPGTIFRQLAWLNDSVWLGTGNHSLRTFTVNRTIVETDELQVESPFALTFSPDRQHFAVSTSGSRVAGGLPLIQSWNGHIAYTFGSLTRGIGVTFTPDGERILASGGKTPQEFVYEFDASNGTALDSVEVPITPNTGSYVVDLKLDALRNRVYLLAICSGDSRIHVFDRSPLRHVGSLPVNYTGTTCGVGGYTDSKLSLEDATNTLYLTKGGVPAERYQFDLLP